VSRFVTTTFLAPDEPDGVVAVMELCVTRITLVAGIPPIETVTPDWNPVPVIVTVVPPVSGPEFGEILITVGAAEVYVVALTSLDRALSNPFLTAASL
jgi:hypothetical protein